MSFSVVNGVKPYCFPNYTMAHWNLFKASLKSISPRPSCFRFSLNCNFKTLYSTNVLCNQVLKCPEFIYSSDYLLQRLICPCVIFRRSNRVLLPSNNIDIGKIDAISSDDVYAIKRGETGVLEPCEDDISDISPFVSPSFNLAAYANQSHTLQQLVKMGVNLHKIETRKGAAECILKLDFEKHMKMHLRFLHDAGVPAEELGNFVTKNPFIFEQSLHDLQVRLNYLETKKFSEDNISRIFTRNPIWPNLNTIEIDKRLGFFQRTFVLSGEEVRHLAVLRPTLITYDLGKVTASLFAVKEDMGFNENEAKELLLKKPKIYDIQTAVLKSRFDYVHNTIGITHDQIVMQPDVLLFRNFIIKQRHEFLKEIGKAQYDVKLPGYVSLVQLVQGSDIYFCKNVAKTSIDVFNAFLKTS